MALVDSQPVTIVGKKWLRAKGMCIYNELDENPTIVWDLEYVTADDSGTIIAKVPAGTQKCQMIPGTVLPILNPITGAKVRDTTVEELYMFLYSAFVQARATLV